MRHGFSCTRSLNKVFERLYCRSTNKYDQVYTNKIFLQNYFTILTNFKQNKITTKRLKLILFVKLKKLKIIEKQKVKKKNQQQRPSFF